MSARPCRLRSRESFTCTKPSAGSSWPMRRPWRASPRRSKRAPNARQPCGEHGRRFRTAAAHREPHPAAARAAPDARCRLGHALRGRNQGAGAGGQTQPGSLSGRFHVPAGRCRVGGFEVTACDLKRARRAALSTLCLHRAGRGYAVFSVGQLPCHRHQHRDHAYLRAGARPGRHPPGSGPSGCPSWRKPPSGWPWSTTPSAATPARS